MAGNTMTYRSAWHISVVTVLALSTAACLSESENDVLSEPDITAAGPAVSITAPNAAAIDTTDASITVSGTTTSNATVESVSWSNDRGGSGVASGLEAWTATDIPLVLGSNMIAVTATDASGASSTDQLTVNRESESTGAATISWNPPTERTDGSPLTDLSGYRIYYGRMSETYDYEIEIDNPGVATYVVEGLVPGDWYFVAAAIDSNGMKSDYSNEVVRKIL
jgi:hypothetical protein